MTALTKDRNTPKRAGNIYAIPVAEKKVIYAGSMVCTDAAGYAIPSADTEGIIFVGIAQEYVDNSQGGNGDEMVLVEHPVIVSLSAADITQADIGKPLFIVDDQTVALNTTHSVACGILREVISATAVWVDTFYCLISAATAAVEENDAVVATEDKIENTDAVASAGAAPTKEEFDAVVTLVNEIKALVTDAPNKTEFDAVVTLTNANKAAVNGLIAKLKAGRITG